MGIITLCGVTSTMTAIRTLPSASPSAALMTPPILKERCSSYRRPPCSLGRPALLRVRCIRSPTLTPTREHIRHCGSHILAINGNLRRCSSCTAIPTSSTTRLRHVFAFPRPCTRTMFRATLANSTNRRQPLNSPFAKNGWGMWWRSLTTKPIAWPSYRHSVPNTRSSSPVGPLIS